MKIYQAIIATIFCISNVAVYGKDDSIIERSKMLDGKLFAVRLHLRNFSKSTEVRSDHPFSFAKTYIDRMEIIYGENEVLLDDARDTYTNLFDPKSIQAIGIARNKQLVFEVEGGDPAHQYKYRFYVDPVPHVRRILDLVRKQSLKSNNTYQPPIDQYFYTVKTLVN